MRTLAAILGWAVLGAAWAGTAEAQESRIGVRTAIGMFAPVRVLAAARSSSDVDVALEPALQVRGELDFRLTEAATLYAGLDYVWTRMQHATTVGLGSVRRDYTGVSLAVPTAGVLVPVPGFSGAIRPTLRLGVGFKIYEVHALTQPYRIRDPTLDVGFGLTAATQNRLDVVAEARWLGSEFRHQALPFMGRTTATQILSDWVVQLGVRFGFWATGPMENVR